MFETKYRVVKDNYCGFEAQYKKWWMPFWRMVPVMESYRGIFGVIGINTALSEQQAKQFIEWYKNGRSGRII